MNFLLKSLICILICIVGIGYFSISNKAGLSGSIDSISVYKAHPIEYFNTSADVAYLFQINRDTFVKQMMSTLTLEEKVGQLFIFKANGTAMTDDYKSFLSKIKPGGIILLGDNVSDALPSFISDIQSTNTILPLFISIDQEGGPVKRINSDTNPGEKDLSNASQDTTCSVYLNRGELLQKIGINLNFGIVADIAWKNSSK